MGSVIRGLFSRLRATDERPISGAPWDLPASPEGRREAAHWAYRLILLREPESQEALDHLARTSASARAMRDVVLESSESRSLGLPTTLSMSGNEPPQPVQVEASPEERARLFQLIQRVWHSLGETRPHWSVITADSFMPDKIGESIDAFYASGEGNVATLLRTLERNGIDRSRLRRAMDFGCGVGRLSAALAPHFEQVHAVDVSASHLAIAKEELAKRGRGNVTTHRLEAIEAVHRLPTVDLIYSVIVLQHNPPPVMRELLRGLLGRLDAGGVAVIQAPTYLAGYRFEVGPYLAAQDHEMEMHALPQREVFKVAREAGVDVLEVLEDSWTGYGVGSQSNTFVMRRPA